MGDDPRIVLNYYNDHIIIKMNRTKIIKKSESQKNYNLIKEIEINLIPSGMMLKNQIYGVIHHLEEVLKNNIEGDIVELGCNVGTTSLFIKRCLEKHKSNKNFHVYDSWEGLPEKLDSDFSLIEGKNFNKGDCKIPREIFVQTFQRSNLSLPEIHSGWFKEIDDSEYPDKICFAFLDGDFYSSIIDSLEKIYHKMTKGGIIIIDDCGWNALPGCKKAVEDFLKDKPEKLLITGYPDNKYKFGEMNCGGKIVKM
tara:strand:+ start:50 stop:808 length:759 start_codon:yes stop_codon:yes gene_type:complete